MNNNKSSSRPIAMLCIVLALCGINAFRVINNSNIRSVDILSLIALGMAIGALIAVLSSKAYRSKSM